MLEYKLAHAFLLFSFNLFFFSRINFVFCNMLIDPCLILFHLILCEVLTDDTALGRIVVETFNFWWTEVITGWLETRTMIKTWVVKRRTIYRRLEPTAQSHFPVTYRELFNSEEGTNPKRQRNKSGIVDKKSWNFFV